MPMFTVGEILEITRGRLLAGSPRRGVRRVWTDSRTVRRGDLFVALSGERFDGHRFVDEAMRKGAVGALVKQGKARYRMRAGNRQPDGAVLIAVKDPLRAFQALAHAHRSRFDLPVIAVSGSNGKTTTKEMIGRVVSERLDTLVSRGNLNNHIGVPQTLFRLTPRHQAAVIEMGISGMGEMARLCEIAQPTHGVLTNIGPTHLATLGTLQNVARAKGELLDALPVDGTAILNADDRFYTELAGRVRGRTISFGHAPRATVRALRCTMRGPTLSQVRVGVRGRARPFTVSLHVSGRHNVANALAATATGIALGIGVQAIRAGLSRYHPSAMRSEVRRWRGATVLNDCYNANPASVRAALQWMADVKGTGRTVAVLGDMLELGRQAEGVHREIGRELARAGTDYLLVTGALGAVIAVGAREAGMAANHVVTANDPAALARRLRAVVRKGDVVLVKGSRGARMERVLEAL